MRKGTKRYVHPKLGEIWLAPDCASIELLKDKKYKKLDVAIEEAWSRSRMRIPEGTQCQM